MSNLIKNLLIALVITAALGAGYYFISSQQSEPLPELTRANPNVALQTEKIIANTQKIETYELDTSIFDDARFRSLVDYRVEIPNVEAGRENPFVPVR